MFRLAAMHRYRHNFQRFTIVEHHYLLLRIILESHELAVDVDLTKLCRTEGVMLHLGVTFRPVTPSSCAEDEVNYLVLDDCDPSPMLLGQYVVQSRGFPRAEKPCQHLATHEN